ncbi:MAG: hypothetical protein IPL79_01805 [Myxococcales bacterium]|nr:hypothetical protein [Myxococcales bacterium]
MSRVLVPLTHRMACLAAALVIAWVAVFSPGANRGDSLAFAAPSAKNTAIRQRVAAAAHAAHPAPAIKGPKRLKAATSPAKRAGLAASARLAGAERPARLYRVDAEPLPDGPIFVNGQSYLAKDVYTQLRGDAEAVMTQLPPKTHYYIGVGRSPTALVTFLSLVAPDNAVSFPSSGLRGGIAPQDIAEFDRHIEALIPPEAFTSGKTIVLMDTVSGGGSLRAMRDRLAAYSLKKYGKPATISLLGLGGTADGITHVVKSTGFLSAGKDDIAPYIGEHQIGRNTLEQLPAKRNPKHADFRSALAQRMMRDDVLDSFIEDGYRRVARLSPSLSRIGVIEKRAYNDTSTDVDFAKFKTALAAEIASASVQPKHAGEELRIVVRYDAEGGRTIVESNLATLKPVIARHLVHLVYDKPGAPAWDLDIRAKLKAGGAAIDANSIVISRRMENTKLRKRTIPSGAPVPIRFDIHSVKPGTMAEAQDAILAVLAPVAWNAEPGAKLRLSMTPPENQVVSQQAIAVSANVPAIWIAPLNVPQALAPFAALMGGSAHGLPSGLDIEVTLDKDGRVSARDAVVITRKDVEVSPKEFPRRPRAITYHRGQFTRMPRAKAITEFKERLASVLGNVVVGGGKPITGHIKLRPARSGFGRDNVMQVALPPSLERLIKGRSLQFNIEAMSDGEDVSSPLDVDIAIKFGADGKLVGEDGIEITFPPREVKREKKVVPHGTMRYSGHTTVSKEVGLATLHRLLKNNLYQTRIDAAAGPVVIEVSKTREGNDSQLRVESDLPVGSLYWISYTWADHISALVGGEWEVLDNVQKRAPLPGKVRIEIDVDKNGQLKLDGSMRLMHVTRRLPFKQPRSAQRLGMFGIGPQVKYDELVAQLSRDIATSWQSLAFDGGANRAFSVTIEPSGREFTLSSELPPELLFELAVGSSWVLQKLVVGDLTQPRRPFTFQIQLDGEGRVAGPGSIRAERPN